MDFQRDVIEASRKQPIVVDFWAPWCGPCRVLGPVLDKLAGEADGQWTLVKLNTEEHPHLAEQYRIASIPAVRMFRDGKVTAQFNGALPEAEIANWLEANLPSVASQAVGIAKELRARGDLKRAVHILEQAIDLEAKNHEARFALAEILLTQDRPRMLKVLHDFPEGHVLFERVQSLRTLAGLPDLLTEAGVTAAEIDTASRGWPAYRRGLEAFSAGNYGDAAAAWIEVLRQDRKLHNDGARRACVALFYWLGEEHPVTREYRRVFSSALF